MLPVASVAVASDTFHAFLVNPNRWPTMADFVAWCQNMDPISGAVLILAGIWFLFSGYKMHRTLVAGNAVIIGAYLGAGLALRYNFPMLAGIPAGALILGVIGWYFTSASAAAIGAACGGLIGAAVWAMCNLPPALTWSGALTGAVALGLLCFIIFRTSVIVFTSLQGSTMFVLGVLGLAYSPHYAFMRPSLDSWLIARPMALPALILAIMLIGMGFQYLKGPAGGKAGSGGGGTSSPKSDSSSKESSPKKEKAAKA